MSRIPLPVANYSDYTGTGPSTTRGDHRDSTIAYEYLGVSYHYEPDFMVRLIDGRTLILEIKGYEDDQDRAKRRAAPRWVSASTTGAS